MALSARQLRSPAQPFGVGNSTLELVGNVDHGLSFPEFDPNNYFAADLFRDSSPLPRTSKAEADQMCLAIEEKKQSLRVAQANISLNQEVVNTGIGFQKFLGSVIDYGTARVNNQAKFVNYQIAGVNLNIAETKLQQANERLTQEQIVLEGMVDLTPLIREEWEQRKALRQSRIEDLRQSVFLANSKLDAEIRQLASAAAG